MTLVLSDGVTPAPPSDIVRRLRQVDPDLGMKWFPSSHCWAITAMWRENDPRRARVVAGEVAPDEAFDAVCFVRESVSAEDAYHYFLRGIRSSSREDIAKLVDEIDKWNEAQPDRNAAPVVEEMLNEIEVMGHGITGTAKQYQNAPAGERKAHFGKGRKSAR